ncbi:glycosyltransferase family 39 protein [Streptomyces sp. NPDC048636]|uniref:glycosyltransferase family 39 protein n=1 Tax=Streptomyces sp. NPDC048636 TaxID=3155762 RepID=UPI0034388041
MFTLDWRESSQGLSASNDHRPRYAHPLALMASVKTIGLLALALWSSLNGRSAHLLLSARWDSLWYVRVVEHGYSFTLTAPDGRVLSDQAFFPLFPAFEKVLSHLLHLSPADAGLLISAASSLFAGAGIYRLVGMFTDRRTALLTVALWATTPVSIVQSMAYSESLFTAAAAWALCFALQEKWVLAGVLACAAGLTRPVGISVALAIWSAVAISVRREGWSAPKVVSFALSPAGFTCYISWVGASRGTPFGYLDVQSEWGNGYDGGVTFIKFLGTLASTPPYAGGIALLIGVGMVIRTYLLGFSARYPLPVQVYSGIVIILALGSSGFFESKPRLLIPAFSLLIPPALFLSRKGSTARVSVIASMCMASAAYGALWLNGSGPP